MDIQFMKDYYDLRYEETDGENHFVDEAAYRKTKAEMQDWLVAQKIVQEILKEDEQKKEQLHEQEVRQEEENRQSSR